MQLIKGSAIGLTTCFLLTIITLSNVAAQEELLTGNMNSSSNFGMLFFQTLTSSNHKLSDYRHSASYSQLLRGSYRSSFATFDATMNGTKALTGEREFNLLDSTIRATKPVYRRGELSVSARGTILIPTSENSADNRQLYTAFTGSSLLIYSPRKIRGLTIIDIPSATYLFNEYEVALTGASNFQYRLGNTLVAFYSLTDLISTAFTFVYNRSYTYQSNQVDQYLFDVAGSISISRNVNLDIGFSNGGNPLTTNGQSNQLRIYDPEVTTYYTTLGITL